MVRTLSEALNYALTKRPDHQVNQFGAAGGKTRSTSSETIAALSFEGAESAPFLLPSDLSLPGDNAMLRMFSLPLGQRAASAIGNEDLTLERSRGLSVEIMAEALLREKRFPRELVQVSYGNSDTPPMFIVMNPDMDDVTETRIVTNEFDLPPIELFAAAKRLLPRLDGTTRLALASYLAGGMDGLAQLFAICRPEVVITRKPKMETLCLPDPLLTATGKLSGTVGIVCVDDQGVMGVTTAWHVAGNTGDTINIDGQNETVGVVSQIQDVAFVPLSGPRPVTVARKVMQGYGPRHQGLLHFEGAVTGKDRAQLVTVSPGLLSRDPYNRLTLQTEMKANGGDSGCALLEGNEVVGFALRNTQPGQYPEFTEWIWADNALAALSLTPL